MPRSIAPCALLMLLAACAGPPGEAGEPADAPPRDADVAAPDAAPRDAAPADAGGPFLDGAGPPDGAAPPDAPAAPAFPTSHPRVYLPGARARLIARWDAGAPSAARLRALVDQQVDGADHYDFPTWAVALAGQLSGDPRYCGWAVASVDGVVAAEEARIAAGQRPEVAADSYLYVGERIGDVALVYDWCFAGLTEAQRTRWLAYADQAVWNVWHPDDARWGGASHPWSGWSVDNPGNNYYASFLRATMLLGLAAHGEHPAAAGWLAYFRDRKLGGQLVPTFEAELQGGGSREGTGYGVAMRGLWALYDLWQGSTGEDVARLTGHTRASMRHALHAIVPTLDRVAPVGDHARDSSAALFDYHRSYLLALAQLFADDPLSARVRWLLAHSSVSRMARAASAVDDFLYDPADAPSAPLAGLGTAYFGPGTGQLYARSGWEADATWLGLVAGPYTESHAHHDQGSLLVFKGAWLALDANLFSDSGIEQGEELHSLVRITQAGATVRQREGTTSRLTALHRGDGWLHAAADLTAAYAGAAAVQRVERELVFVEPDVVVVCDRVATAAGTAQVWQLNVPAAPQLAGGRATVVAGGHALDVHRLAPEAPVVAVHAWAGDGGFSGGYRLDETSPGGGVTHLHVLALDGAAAAVARSDAGGRLGVEVTLADGGHATVRCSPAGVDGTLALRRADGGELAAALGPGVEPLPE